MIIMLILCQKLHIYRPTYDQQKFSGDRPPFRDLWSPLSPSKVEVLELPIMVAEYCGKNVYSSSVCLSASALKSQEQHVRTSPNFCMLVACSRCSVLFLVAACYIRPVL